MASPADLLPRTLRSVAGAVLVVVALAAASCEPEREAPGDAAPPPPASPACGSTDLPGTVAYRSLPGVDPDLLSLDVHAPTPACDAPVVVWVHGGGYHVGDKANAISDKRARFNAEGWILVSVNYRLTVAGDPGSPRYPDHYDDVAAALAWIRAEIGAYGGDPDRLALLGHSAGGDIVANVANRPEHLADHGLVPGDITCAGPLDTEGFDKVAMEGTRPAAQWESALGTNPDYRTETSATRFLTPDSEVPDTIGVVRGTPRRRQIQQDYHDAVAATGASVTVIDAGTLDHAEVNTRIGAPGDTVMTPPLIDFLTDCFD